MLPAGPPWHVRTLRAMLRRVPRGRYRLLAHTPHSGRFVATLARAAGGARFACDLSDQIAHEAYFSGVYEPPVTRIIRDALPAGGTFVDAGANWGYFTLVGAAAIGPSGRVIAIEPDPRMFAALEGNVRLNAVAHVKAVRAAAAATEGRAALAGFRPDAVNRGTSRLGGGSAAGPTFDVDCVTIDRLTSAIPSVDVVKIDVEGAEDAVLEGMQQGFAANRYRSVVLELHPGHFRAAGIDPARPIRRLLEAGFTGATIDMSPGTYRRALDGRVTIDELLLPLDRWPDAEWPHLLLRKC
jgi:FkbM family methyltransferase